MQLTETKRHQICEKAIELKKDIEFRFIELGALLYQIREERHYEAGWSSWEEYAMELKMRTSTISRLISIYEEFVLRFKIPHAELASAGGWSVLAEILPDINETTTKQEITSWLGEASQLARPDLRRAITERRRGVDMAKCAHKDTYTIKICRTCGEKWTEHGNQNNKKG